MLTMENVVEEEEDKETSIMRLAIGKISEETGLTKI